MIIENHLKTVKNQNNYNTVSVYSKLTAPSFFPDLQMQL